jgi:uncharacterized membrane protein
VRDGQLRSQSRNLGVSMQIDLSDPLRHHKHYDKNSHSPYAGGSSFMERVAEGVATGMGTVPFVVIGSLIIIAWVFVNGAAHYISTTVTNLAHGKEFDAEPWVLLNLIFSGVAFYTGSLVIIAQKAQTRTDKANEEAAAKHRDELYKYQVDLIKQNTDLTQQIHDLAEKLSTLTEEVHEATCLGAPRGALPTVELPKPPGDVPA